MLAEQYEPTAVVRVTTGSAGCELYKLVGRVAEFNTTKSGAVLPTTTGKADQTQVLVVAGVVWLSERLPLVHCTDKCRAC